MACGDPVICQIDGVIREVVEENNAGVFAEPGDPQALADAVLKLAGDPEGCRRMGENGQRTIREKFSRDSAEEQLEQIFMDLSKNNKERVCVIMRKQSPDRRVQDSRKV